MKEEDFTSWLNDDEPDTENPTNPTHEEPTPTPDFIQLPDEEYNHGALMRAMTAYHEMGLSLMWGRAKDDDGGEAKSPLRKTWKELKDKRLSLQQLFNTLANPDYEKSSLAPIIICGKASGNLIVIDIDIKHWPGIDAVYFAAIQDLLPDIWPLLRIHQTPSKGWHIFYRTETFIVLPKANPKLAWSKDSAEAGIESRTHGGYVLAPPGMGYTVFRDVPIPTVSEEVHNNLFNLAKGLNERAEVKEFKPKAKEASNFNESHSTSPWDDYNQSWQGAKLLESKGWTIYKENDSFVHYTRPGKDKGLSASFIKKARLFYNFSSSADLPTNETLSPAWIRNLLDFNGDTDKTTFALLNEGFGTRRELSEQNAIKKAVISGKKLPPGFTPEAIEKLKAEQNKHKEKYPHGVFWEYNEEKSLYTINPQLLLEFCHTIGLRLYRGEPCRIDKPFIHKLKEEKKVNGNTDVSKELFKWIEKENIPETKGDFINIANAFHAYWEKHGEYIVRNLSQVDENELLTSDEDTTYKVFLNGIVTITKDEITRAAIEKQSLKLIWADSVIQRDFNYIGEDMRQRTMFVDFVNKAIKNEIKYVKQVFGYLSCDFKGEGEGNLILLMEARDPKKGGGSGKGFTMKKGIGLMTSVLETLGEIVKEKESSELFQNWSGQKVVHFSDLPKFCDISKLKGPATDDSQLKRLYKDLINVPDSEMPKIVGSLNWGIDVESDGGIKGRVKILSYSDYFSRKEKTIEDEYGGKCPKIWDKGNREGCNDWDGYYSFMMECIQEYLKSGRKMEDVEDVDMWLKNFDVRFSEGQDYLREAIEDIYEGWSMKEAGEITSKYLEMWYEESGVGKTSRRKLSIKGIHQALREYGEKTGKYEYSNEKTNKLGRHSVVRIVERKEEGKEDEGWDKVQVDPEEDDGEKVPF